MKLSASFRELDALRRRMGAPLREWRASIEAAPLQGITHQPRETEIGDLGDLQVGPGDTIISEGRRVFLYIREFRVEADSFDEATRTPDKLRRFHIAWCQTLKEMKARGRFERYVASDRVDQPFGVALELSGGSWACGDTELHVCQNCLKHTNWQGFHDARGKDRMDIVRRFSRRLFLEKDTTRFADLPRTADHDAPALGYAADWQERSRAYRTSVGFRCEDCGVGCSTHRDLLDTHHLNGVTGDNRISNLRALCKLCHRDQHPNWYRVSAHDQRRIEVLRSQRRGA